MGTVQALPTQRRIAPLSAAEDAYRAATPAACIALVYGHTGTSAQLLRTRANLRLGRADAALAALDTIDPARVASTLERTEYFVLRGAVQTRLRRFDAARDSLDDARVYALGAASAGAEAEYHFYEAVWSFAAPDFARADNEAVAAGTVRAHLFENDGYFVSLANTRARALQVRGLIAAGQERYLDQAAHVRAALDEMQRAAEPDLWVRASLLMNLAFAVRDFDLVDDARRLRAEMTVAAWPTELAAMEFEIYRALGWSSALRGDHLGAFREFRRSAERAPTTAAMIVASTDRAYLGRELGETHGAREELEYAADLANTVDWDAVGGDGDRFGLLLLARELAYENVIRARATYERYRAIKTKLSPGALNAFDRRIRAHESLADGTILRREGKLDAARERLTAAFTIWRDLGYGWLAATAAIELDELGAGASFSGYARREAQLRPHSWLARRFQGRGLAQLAGGAPRSCEAS